MLNAIISAAIWLGIKVLEVLPGKLVDAVFARLGRQRPQSSKDEAFSPYPSDCGDRAIDLGFRRPHVAESFGGYFTGLLEDSGGYIRIDEQVDCPSTPETTAFAPVARILYELRKPTGPKLVVIAAAGGMGKTTLATKIVKCLYEQQDADFILGDSAKTEHTDPSTGNIYKFDPSFRDVRSFYRRLYAQVGLPAPQDSVSTSKMIETLNDQLRDFHAVIVIDNLDTVENINTLLSTLKPLLSRRVRAVVTTREIASIGTAASMTLTAYLRPLTTVETAKAFLDWHVQHYQTQRPRLAEVARGLDRKRTIKTLIDKSGGIPLIMQLVLNDVETKSWAYIEKLPVLDLSSQFLDYLYKARWDELDRLGVVGTTAQRLVDFVGTQQMRGKRTTFADLNKWAQNAGTKDTLTEALGALEDRFLLLNRDLDKGNFSVFPSLADFMKKRATPNVATD